MNRWIRNFLLTTTAFLAIALSIFGDKGLSGQQSIARGWDLVSGEIGVSLEGFPGSDLIWFFVFQIGGWVGVLSLLGAFALAFVMVAIIGEEKAGLPLGSLSLLIFVFGKWFIPGSIPFLFFLVSFSPRILRTNNWMLIFGYQVFWILATPMSCLFGIGCWIFGAKFARKNQLLLVMGLLGLIWDFWRIGPVFQGGGYLSEYPSNWSLGLGGALLARVLFARFNPAKTVLTQIISGAGVVGVWILIGGLFGSNLVAYQISRLFPQVEHLRAYSELYRARQDLVSLPINTHSQWVRDWCRVTAGLRHCEITSKSPGNTIHQFFLIGDPDPRKSAATLVSECGQNSHLTPRVFSGPLCLLEESKLKATPGKFQGLGVWRSAESVMAFAWFEVVQNRPKELKENIANGLKLAWTWAEMAMRQNPRDALAWGITGELILAKHFLNPGNSPLAPMEQEAWMAQAAFCFRKSLDLNPFDRKIRRVFSAVLRQEGALDLAESIMESATTEGIIHEPSRESFFLEQGPAKVMDLKHLLEFRFPGEIDRSLDRIRHAVALGLKGQALGELDRGGAERFGVEGARIRLKLLLEAGFAEVTWELANLQANQSLDLGLMEWKRPGGGNGLGATWKLPTIAWVQCVSNLAMHPHGGSPGGFDSLRKILKEDLFRVQGRLLNELPLVLAKNILVLPGNPLALRIEGAMEYSSRENLAQLGMAISEELMALDRLERASGSH